MSLFIIGTKFFKISVNLRCDLCMKKQLDQLTAYTPGLSPESLKKQYGIKGELHKLASNENVYGPSPKVKTAIQSHLDELYYYPESGSPKLREAISQQLNVDASRILFGAGLDEVHQEIRLSLVNLLSDNIIIMQLWNQLMLSKCLSKMVDLI